MPLLESLTFTVAIPSNPYNLEVPESEPSYTREFGILSKVSIPLKIALIDSFDFVTKVTLTFPSTFFDVT